MFPYLCEYTLLLAANRLRPMTNFSALPSPATLRSTPLSKTATSTSGACYTLGYRARSRRENVFVEPAIAHGARWRAPMYASPVHDIDELKRLIRAGNSCVRIVTDDEPEAYQLALSAGIDLGFEVHSWSVLHGLRDARIADAPAVEDSQTPAGGLMRAIELQGRPMVVLLDLAAHLDDPRALRAFRELAEKCRAYSQAIVMIDHSARVPDVVGVSSTQLYLSPPGEEEIEQIARAAIRARHQVAPVRVDLTKGGLRTMIQHMRGLSRRQVRQLTAELVTEDSTLNAEDLQGVVRAKRRMLENVGLLEFVDAPSDMNELGGMDGLKSWLKAREGALSTRAREFGLEPAKGVLLLGVQGAGKSLCAKAIAAAWKRPLLRLDPGVLYDRYVGESERRLRAALHQAEAMSPVVLWIDEIEKAFASAASHSTDGGLSQRMFGTLLTWLQEKSDPVFVVATANDIDALPPELLRKGRFDEIFFVDLPGEEARRRIFEIHLRRRKRDPAKFDVAELARVADGYSGAEIEQAIVAALHAAFAANADVDTPALARAVRASPPLSVTMAERIGALREWARGRCVPAG